MEVIKESIFGREIVGKLPQLRLQHHGETTAIAHSLGLIFSSKVRVQDAVARTVFTLFEIAVSQTFLGCVSNIFLAMIAETKSHCLTCRNSLGLLLGRGCRCFRFCIPFSGRGLWCWLCSLWLRSSLCLRIRFHFHKFGNGPWYWKNIPTKVAPIEPEKWLRKWPLLGGSSHLVSCY